MLGSWTTPALASQKFCVPWNPNDPLLPLYQQMANQFNTINDPSLAAMIMVALQNQMMLYNKATCTDCATQGLPPTQTVINPPVNSGTPTPVGIVQTNNTDAEIGAAVQIGSQAASTIAKATGALSAIPVIGAVASVISDIVGIFGAHHAQAVAEEQATNCAVAFGFNKWIPQYDAAVANGSMSAAAALSAVTQIIQSQLIPALGPVISGHNIGWGERQILMAHLAFRQAWYPQLETAASSLASKASSVLASVNSELTSSPTLLLALVAVLVVAFGGRKAEATT